MSDDSLVESFFSISRTSPSPAPSGLDSSNAECDAKDRIAHYQPRSATDKTANVLQAFVNILPQAGKDNIVPFINNCTNDSLLRTFSDHLCSAVLVAMKARSTPAVTPSPLEDAEARVERVASGLVTSSTRDSQSTLKSLCLQRDGYKCMMTSLYDNITARPNLPAGVLEGSLTATTVLAHIIPFAVGKYSKKSEEVKVARIWDALYTCFPALQSRTNITPDNINDPSNLMTLTLAAHEDFGRFLLTLEPTDTENVYQIQTYPDSQSMLSVFLPKPNENSERIVEFKKHSDLALPDPVLLETHALIARILHASGMAELIDEVEEKRDRIGCLASDGATDVQQLLTLLAY